MAEKDTNFATLETAQTASPDHRNAPQTEQSNEVSLFDLLIAIAEKRRLILAATGVFLVASIILCLVLPSRYTADAILMPPQQNSSIGAALTSQLGGLGGMSSLASSSLGLKNVNDMYVAMIRSRVVEDAIVHRFDLMKLYKQKYPSEARRALERHVVVDGSGKDNLIHISCWDKDPNRAAAIVNGMIEEYRSFSANLAITEAAQRRLFLEKQMKEAKDNLADAEESLKRTEQSTGVIQLDSQARVLIETAASLQARISAMEVQIRTMGVYAQDENAQVIQARQELAGLREQLSKLEGQGNKQEKNGLMIHGGQVTQTGLEYVRRLRDVKYYETIFEIMARQYEMAKFDEAKQGGVIQVVVPAIPPDKRSFPKWSILVPILTGAGFLFAVIFVAARFEMKRFAREPLAEQKLATLRRTLSSSKRR